MAKKNYQINQKLSDGSLLTLHPETEASIVEYNDTEGLGSTNVQGAITKVAQSLKGMITQGVVTGVKGNAESVYRKGDVNITASNIGLGNVNNTSDTDKPISKAQQGALDKKVDKTTTVNGKALSGNISLVKSDVGLGNVTNETQIPLSKKGVANGVAELDENGKVPSSQLPSYVDDVMSFANKAGFPLTGEDGKIYLAKDTNLQYRWSGEEYVVISPSLALGETASTAYAGNKGKANAQAISTLQGTVSGHTTQISSLQGTVGTHTTEINNIKNGTTKVGNADKLDGQDSTYYLDYKNLKNTPTIPTMPKIPDVTTGVSGSGNFVKGISASGHKVTATLGNITNADLPNSGVPQGTYSVVTVNTKGVVTGGAQVIEVGATAPSASLAVGGIFFKEIV